MTELTQRTRKPLIALLVAAGSLMAAPAFAQSAQESAAQAQAQAAQAQQAASQAGQAADQASAQASGGGQTWASIDTDGNGTISKSEAQVNAGLAQVFDQADTDKNGELTPDEYKAFVATQQGAAASGASGAASDGN